MVRPGRAAASAADPYPVPWTADFSGQVAERELTACGVQRLGLPALAPPPAPGDPRPRPRRQPDRELPTISPFLANHGFCVFALTYGTRPEVDPPGYQPGGLVRMQSSARKLKRFAARVIHATGAKKVDVVGHSEGSLMPDWWVKYLGGRKVVAHYVGMTPLWNGTNLAGLATVDRSAGALGLSPGVYAALGRFCASCHQFLNGSRFLRKLNAQGGPRVEGIKYTMLLTRNDELVSPYTSGLMDGARQRRRPGRLRPRPVRAPVDRLRPDSRLHGPERPRPAPPQARPVRARAAVRGRRGLLGVGRGAFRCPRRRPDPPDRGHARERRRGARPSRDDHLPGRRHPHERRCEARGPWTPSSRMSTGSSPRSRRQSDGPESTLAETTEILTGVRGLLIELQEEMALVRQVPEIAEQVREIHAAVVRTDVGAAQVLAVGGGSVWRRAPMWLIPTGPSREWDAGGRSALPTGMRTATKAGGQSARKARPTSRKARRGAYALPSSPLELLDHVDGLRVDAVRGGEMSETRSPSITVQSSRWVRVSPSVSTRTTASAVGLDQLGGQLGALALARVLVAVAEEDGRERPGSPFGLPADDLVVVELRKLGAERVLLGVLVDLALPAVGDRDGQVAAVDQRDGALRSARRSRRRSATSASRGLARCAAAESISVRMPGAAPTSAAISQATVNP